MSKSLLIIAFVASACVQSHGSGAQSVDFSNCYACHAPEYQATASPPHTKAGCSTTCSDCHDSTAWADAMPATQGACGVHPEAQFAISSGSHANIACLSCHVASMAAAAKQGANTDCTSCHTRNQIDPTHTGVSGYAYGSCGSAGAPCTQHNFCLTCHPAGTASGGHPQDRFPLPHGNSTCVQCHDQTSTLPPTGGQNVLCMNGGCHTNAHHADTSHHPGCLTCHPSGQGD